MEAGRFLDALIHVKVMGKKSFDLASDRPPTATECLDRELRLATLPHYSTDIKDAWEVVGKIKFYLDSIHDIKHQLAIEVIYLNDAGGGDLSMPWTFQVKWKEVGEEGDSGDFFHFAECGSSAPHAICLVALKVI